MEAAAPGTAHMLRHRIPRPLMLTALIAPLLPPADIDSMTCILLLTLIALLLPPADTARAMTRNAGLRGRGRRAPEIQHHLSPLHPCPREKGAALRHRGPVVGTGGTGGDLGAAEALRAHAPRHQPVILVIEAQSAVLSSAKRPHHALLHHTLPPPPAVLAPAGHLCRPDPAGHSLPNPTPTAPRPLPAPPVCQPPAAKNTIMPPPNCFLPSRAGASLSCSSLWPRRPVSPFPHVNTSPAADATMSITGGHHDDAGYPKVPWVHPRKQVLVCPVAVAELGIVVVAARPNTPPRPSTPLCFHRRRSRARRASPQTPPAQAA